jgi:hypothetical protein
MMASLMLRDRYTAGQLWAFRVRFSNGQIDSKKAGGRNRNSMDFL